MKQLTKLVFLTFIILAFAGIASLNAQWVEDGIQIFRGAAGYQTIASDNAGGAIIIWVDSDVRSFEHINVRIYAQRIDADGYIQWTAGGVLICTAETEGPPGTVLLDPAIIADGNGGAIITWADQSGWDDKNDIYAQRIDANGNVLWAADGVVICTASGNQTDPQLVSDGSGGAIITWEDHRTSGINGIHAQRIDANGNVLWTTNGIVVGNNNQSQYNPQIISYRLGGVIITWDQFEFVSANKDIYAQKIDASGNVLWATSGVAVCTASGEQSNPQLISDSSSGAIIVWQDARNKTSWSNIYDIYAQRINPNGNAFWTADGVAICDLPCNQTDPQLCTDGTGGAIITWEDTRLGCSGLVTPKVYTQRIDRYGNVLWTANGIGIRNANGSQKAPQITSDGSGGAIIVWENHDASTHTDHDIYAQNIDANGNSLWTTDGVAICTADDYQGSPQLISDDADGAIFTWKDDRDDPGYYQINIYAQKYPASLTTPTEIIVTYPNGGETWYVGNSYNITWESDSYVGTVKIQLSTSGGSSWYNVISNTGNDGSHYYTPDQGKVSNQCLIKVTSNEATSVSDQSDDLFTIEDANATPAPTNLTTLNGYHQAIPLVWKAPQSGTPQGYNVYRNSNKIASNITRTYYRDEPVTNGQTFNYHVTATYSGGESDFSNNYYGNAMTDGYYINAGWASSTPNLDGNINSNEWTNAATRTISYPGESGTVRLYVMNDNNYLYFAVDDGVDNSLDINDTFGIIFDDNHNRELPSSGPSSEGLIQMYWNNSALNGFLGVYGYFPDNLNFDGWTTPTGVNQGISQTSGHVHYEGRIDLQSSSLQSSPGNNIGITFYTWDGASSNFTGIWPEALLELQSYASGFGWFYGPFSYGDIKLASSTGDTPGSKKWEFVTGGFVDSSPAIGSDGTIYVGSHDYKLYAINPNGTKKWDYETELYIVSSPAIGIDGTIYVGSHDHKLYAINPNGTKKWDYETEGYVYSSPAIGSDGTIYAGSFDNKLYAINPNGTKKWDYETGDNIQSNPAIGSDGTIYVGSWDNKLYAINPDGTKKWDYETGDNIQSNPAIGSDGTIYIGSNDYKLWAINPNGTKNWDYETGGNFYSGPAIGADGTIYIGSNDDNLYAINPNGTKKWHYETGGNIHPSPAIGSDGTIYVGSHDHKLYAINPNGTKKWEYTTLDIVRSSPAIGLDGTIYVGSRDGKLYAINGNSGGLADTPWPMFHQNVRHTGSVETSGNILINGNFSNNDDGWTFSTFESAQANGSVVNGEFVVSITNGGTEPWHVQLVQGNVPIEHGKHYQVTFEAYASSPRVIISNVLHHGTPWTLYSNKEEISLTTQKQLYSYSFIMTEPTDYSARFDLNMGLSDVDVFFDNINIIKTESTGFWADVDDDGDVDVLDIQKVAAHWNTSLGDPGYDPKYDVDNEGQGDGDIDVLDIQLVASWWNKL